MQKTDSIKSLFSPSQTIVLLACCDGGPVGAKPAALQYGYSLLNEGGAIDQRRACVRGMEPFGGHGTAWRLRCCCYIRLLYEYYCFTSWLGFYH